MEADRIIHHVQTQYHEKHMHALHMYPERTPEWDRHIQWKLRRQRVLGLLMCLVALAMIIVVHRILD